MKRTVNLKAVAILAGIAVTFGVAVHFAHGYQVKRNSRDLLEQATQAQRDGQLAETATHLEHYLGFVPDDIDAQARYALALKDLAVTQQQKLRAFFVLEKVLLRDGSRQDVRRAVAEIGMLFGRFREAGDYLKTLREKAPDNADLALLHGQCELGIGDVDRASKTLVLATELAPQRIDIAVKVATLLRGKRMEQRAKADDVIEKMADRGRPQKQAHEAAAGYYAQNGDLVKAEQQVNLALADTPTPSAELLLLAADVAQRQDKFAETRKYLERGMSLHAKDARIARALARIDIREGRRDEAKDLLANAGQSTSERPEDLFITAETLIELGQEEQAQSLIKKLETAKAPGPAGLLRGRLAMKKAEWGKAQTELEKARNIGLPPILMKFVYAWMAECYGRLGFVDQELVAYRRASEIDSTWPPAQLGLAHALAATGQLEPAIDAYRRLLLNPTTDVRKELARLLLARMQREPNKERDFEEIDRLLKSDPANSQAVPVLLQAEVLLAKGKPQDAQKILEVDRDRDPTQIGVWIALANLAQRSGPADADLAVLADAEKRLGPRVEWELARASHWVRVSPTDSAAQLKKLESSVDRFPAADGMRLLAGLAALYKFTGDAASAQRLWVQIAERAPDNLAVQFDLFESAMQAGADAEADRYLKNIRDIEGSNGPLAAYGEAARFIVRAVRGDASALTAANEPLAKAAELFPTWSRLLSLQGQALELSGRPEMALAKYQEAIERGENRLGVVGRTLQLLYQRRRFAEANTLASKLSKQSLAETGIGRLVAQVWAVSPAEEGTDPKANRQRAFELARQTVKVDSRNYGDYLWLAQVAVVAEQPAEAEQALRQALRLEPTAADAWVMLVILVSKKDPKKADAELESARQLVPADRLAAVLAPCLDALGRTKEADEQYKAALVARPNDVNVLRGAADFLTRTGQATQAVPLLRNIINPAFKAPQDILAGARRTLALTLALTGDYSLYREAIALIDANGSNELQDRFAKALILAAQPANRRDAIKMFEDLASRQETVPPDARFIMAQLYEADGNWNKARLYMLGLVNEFDKNPTYLSRYIGGLLRHDGADEAGQFVDKLVTLIPESFAAAEIKARVLKAQKRPATEAAEPVRAYVRGKDARKDLAAGVLEDFGMIAEAEMLYRQLAESSPRPEAKLLLASFLARQKRLPEALSLCEKAWTNCSPEAVAFCCVNAVRVGDANGAQYQQVEQWLEAAIAKNPQSALLLAILGTMYESIDRSADAAARYRQVLQKDPRNFLALNNLACLLALRENKPAEALALINQAIDVAGPNAELLDSRALVYLQAGQPGPALRDIQQAIAQTPLPSKTFNYRLAQVHLANKNRSGAIEAMTEAKKLGLKASDLIIAERGAMQKLVDELNLN